MLRAFLVVLAARGTRAISTDRSGGSGHVSEVLSTSEDLPRANAQLQVSWGAAVGKIPAEDGGVEVGVPVSTARRRRRSLPLATLQHIADACKSGVITAAGAPCHPSQQQKQRKQTHTDTHKFHPEVQFALGSSGELAFPRLPSPHITAPAALDTAKQPEFIHPFAVGGLLLELHLPGATLQQLHSAAHGSLAEFLRGLHGDLSTAAHVEQGRIAILGIHGRYRRVDPGFTEKSFPMPQHIDEEVLVRFEIVPTKGSTLDEAAVIASLQQELASQQSTMMHGTLGSIMQNATVTRALPDGIVETPQEVRRESAHVSAIFLPIGVSAAFTGILIWLAAW